MTSPIFVDTNIPIYAAGAEHSLKQPSLAVLALVERDPGRFVTSAEVLQELVHVYRRRKLWPAARPVFQGFLDLMAGRIEAVDALDVARAAELADRYLEIESRDLLHVAVMLRLGTQRIVSADTAFDRMADVRRLAPAAIESWGNP